MRKTSGQFLASMFRALVLTAALASHGPIAAADQADGAQDYDDRLYEHGGEQDQTPVPDDDQDSSARHRAPEAEVPDGCPYRDRPLELIV